MTDLSLDISAALHEAKLQHLEDSLAVKAAKKPATTAATTFVPGWIQLRLRTGLKRLTGTPPPHSVVQAIEAMRLNTDDFVP